MHYYHVWVRSNQYRSKQPLTYGHQDLLKAGTIVEVSLQNNKVLGFIAARTTKPRFKTKDIGHIYKLPPLNLNLIKLAQWLIEYYPSPLGVVSQQFLPVKLNERYLEDINLKGEESKPDLSKLPPLTEEQEAALEQMTETNTFLLHGKTGTGKTRVYLELAVRAMERGKSSIILTPEISLTSQLYANFYNVFKDRVVLIHSRQTVKERQLAWLKCLLIKDPLVIIGPRSALFSPVNNLGLIVVDEAHEPAYKQDQLPHYQTIRVASTLASLNRSSLVIGSATPSVNDYFLASEKGKPIIKLTQLATKPDTKKTEVVLVDIKDRSNFSNSNVLSDQLIEAIKNSLEKKEQSLIYLNRRGTSRLILCQNCGWEAMCPHCNLPLTYHGDLHQLRCHSCDHKETTIPSICPSCDSDSIIYQTAGTKAIVDEVSRLFIGARISRFDTDNSKADSIAENFEDIKDGKVDIIIGTQLLAKGFDLPLLSTVGLVQADTNLYLPDFSSQERTYQLISQVLGRVNRGHRTGKAIIQSYSPNSPLLKAAINQDFDSFYKSELIERKNFRFPPFFYLLKLTCRRSSTKNAEHAALKLKTDLEALGLPIKIEGPTPAFHEKFQNKYQWQLVVKATQRKHLTDVVAQLPGNWVYDLDPTNLL